MLERICVSTSGQCVARNKFPPIPGKGKPPQSKSKKEDVLQGTTKVLNAHFNSPILETIFLPQPCADDDSAKRKT